MEKLQIVHLKKFHVLNEKLMRIAMAAVLVTGTVFLSACNQEDSSSSPGYSSSKPDKFPVTDSVGSALANEAGVVAIEQSLGEPKIIPLVAGQHIEVGTVTVTNTESSIIVVYETTEEWGIKETHLDVALDYSGLHTNRSGNPQPGKFDQQTSHPQPVMQVTYVIDDLEWTAGMDIYIATHAVVVSQQGKETAWAGDLDFPGRNWATYFAYTTQEANVDPRGTLQFSQPVYPTKELGRSNENLVIIEVQRVGGSSGTISAVYSVVGGTATNFEDDPGNADYVMESSQGLLEFSEGETLKTISIIILDDNDYEVPNETIHLELRDSCCLDSQSSTIVDIEDDEELN